MDILISLGEIPSIRQRSRLLGLTVRPILEAAVSANQVILMTHRVPPLYQSGVRYREEPRGQGYEEFALIPTVLARKWGDCFPTGTLLLTSDYDLVPIESIEAGDRIWGRDEFVEVEQVVFKGELVCDAIHLNNGSTVRMTPEHHVFLKTGERVRVSDLQPGAELLQPERIAFGENDLDPDLHHLDGLYLSDGWSDKSSRFCISGQDGCPKEEQKRRVAKICERLGVATRWNRKYIAVNNRKLAIRMGAMGHRAPDKHALSLDLNEASAAALLAGIMADSGKNSNGGRTFTSTSRMLAVQTRVLHRMFGRSASYRFVESHGGLGKNPIHRLGIREPLQKPEKRLCVDAIDRGWATLPCYDIQTRDHHVYLPEHDVTVSNCDDLAPWRVAELRQQGEKAKIRITFKRQPSGFQLYHVLVRRGPTAQFPQGQIEDPSRLLGMNAG